MDMVIDYEIKGRTKNNGEVRFFNRKSRKKGETFRKATASMEVTGIRLWLTTLQKNWINKLWAEDFYKKYIESRRIEYDKTDGKLGYSPKDALELYRFIAEYLDAENFEKELESYDGFTWKKVLKE